MFQLSVERRLALAWCFALSAGCAEPLTHDECEQLLDRYTELLVRQDIPDARPEQVTRLREEARRRAATQRMFPQCSARVSRSQWHCAVAAPNVDELEKCLL